MRNTVDWMDPDWFISIRSAWEMLIGASWLFRPLTRVALPRLFLQMPGTLLTATVPSR